MKINRNQSLSNEIKDFILFFLYTYAHVENKLLLCFLFFVNFILIGEKKKKESDKSNKKIWKDYLFFNPHLNNIWKETNIYIVSWVENYGGEKCASITLIYPQEKYYWRNSRRRTPKIHSFFFSSTDRFDNLLRSGSTHCQSKHSMNRVIKIGIHINILTDTQNSVVITHRTFFESVVCSLFWNLSNNEHWTGLTCIIRLKILQSFIEVYFFFDNVHTGTFILEENFVIFIHRSFFILLNRFMLFRTAPLFNDQRLFLLTEWMRKYTNH